MNLSSKHPQCSSLRDFLVLSRPQKFHHLLDVVAIETGALVAQVVAVTARGGAAAAAEVEADGAAAATSEMAAVAAMAVEVTRGQVAEAVKVPETGVGEKVLEEGEEMALGKVAEKLLGARARRHPVPSPGTKQELQQTQMRCRGISCGRKAVAYPH